MNTKSIRFRLTFWYTVSLIAAIIVIFTSFYFVTRQTLHTQTDSTLTSHSEKIVEVVTREGSNMHQAIAKEAFVEEFSNIPGMLVVIMNSSGMIVSSSQTVSPTDSVIRNLFERASLSGKPFFADQTIRSQNLRFLTTPIFQNNSFLGVVIMGHPIDVIQKALNSLVSTLGIVFVVFLMPAMLGGYLNARGAVAPISAISEKLKQINSGNLNKRIENPHTADEIEELAVAFNSLLDRLHSAFIRERQFIGDIAHKLKTPLATQRSNIEVIRSKDREKKEYINALDETLIDNKRISGTLENILDLAWSEAEINTQFETFNLSELIEEIRELAIKMVTSKNIKIMGEIEPNIKIHGKRDKLFHAVLNLVDNAVKYTQEKGTIFITLNKTPHKVHLQIKDNGMGISKSDLPHIFERFYRGSKNENTPGSGLGLAIAQAIISSHHGKIDIESKAGQGTIVSISFPIT